MSYVVFEILTTVIFACACSGVSRVRLGGRGGGSKTRKFKWPVPVLYYPPPDLNKYRGGWGGGGVPGNQKTLDTPLACV